ncbi:dipeptidase [Caldicellulosiruptor hydrothermalis]|nr:membrane dipeptidase [Caldicellulosiruptor hydrothermalis]
MFADAHNDTVTTAFSKGENLYKNSCQFDFKRANKVDLKLQYMAIWQDTRQEGIDFLKNAFYFLDRINEYEINNVGLSQKIEDGMINVLLSIEDISFINDTYEIELLKQRGVKSATLSWNYENKLCGGAYSDKGLTSTGREVLKKLLEENFIIDLAHASKKTFFDVVKHLNKPFIVSHSNCFSLCPHPRNLTDEQIKIVRDFDGIIGINFYSPFVKDEGKANLNDVARHIAYIAELIGAQYISFGSDFDGADDFTDGLRGVEDLPNIQEELKKWGFSEKEIMDICYFNLTRFTERFLK